MNATVETGEETTADGGRGDEAVSLNRPVFLAGRRIERVEVAVTAPDVDEDATLEFTLAVSDGQGKVDTRTVLVTVRGTRSETTTVPSTPPETTARPQKTTERGGGNAVTKDPIDNSKTPPNPDDTAPLADPGEATTGSGSGPGFGSLLGMLGIAGGAVYTLKRRLSDE